MVYVEHFVIGDHARTTRETPSCSMHHTQPMRQPDKHRRSGIVRLHKHVPGYRWSMKDEPSRSSCVYSWPSDCNFDSPFSKGTLKSASTAISALTLNQTLKYTEASVAE